MIWTCLGLEISRLIEFLIRVFYYEYIEIYSYILNVYKNDDNKIFVYSYLNECSMSLDQLGVGGVILFLALKINLNLEYDLDSKVNKLLK